MSKMSDCRVPTLEDKIVSKTFKYFTSEHTAEGISTNKLTYMLPPSPFFNVGNQNVELNVGRMFQISTLKKGEGSQGKDSLALPS